MSTENEVPVSGSDIADLAVDFLGHISSAAEDLEERRAKARNALPAASEVPNSRVTEAVGSVDTFLDFFWGPLSAVQDLTAPGEVRESSDHLRRFYDGAKRARDGLLVVHSLAEKYKFARGVLIGRPALEAEKAAIRAGTANLGLTTVTKFVKVGSYIAAVWWSAETGWAIGSALDGHFRWSDQIVGISYDTTKWHSAIETSRPLDVYKYPMATIFRYLESGQTMTPMLREHVKRSLEFQGREWPSFSDYPQYLRQIVVERELSNIIQWTRETLNTLDQWGFVPSAEHEIDSNDPSASPILLPGSPADAVTQAADEIADRQAKDSETPTEAGTEDPTNPNSDADATEPENTWPNAVEPTPFDSDLDGSPDMTLAGDTLAMETPDVQGATPQDDTANDNPADHDASDEVGRALDGHVTTPLSHGSLQGDPMISGQDGDQTPRPPASDELDFGAGDAATVDRSDDADISRPKPAADELDFSAGHAGDLPGADDELDFTPVREEQVPEEQVEPADEEIVVPADRG